MRTVKKAPGDTPSPWDRAKGEILEGLSADPLREALGAPAATALETSASLFLLAIAAVQTAGGWFSPGQGTFSLAGVLSVSLTTLLWSVAIVAAWAIVFGLFFRYLDWTRWLVPPYVLGILCPSTWLFAYHLKEVTAVLLLLSLQGPIVAAVVWRVRREDSGSGKRSSS